MRIPLEVRPYIRNLRRVIVGPGSPASIAFEQETLFPAEKAELMPAIILPGHIEKISGSTPESTIENELELFCRREVVHAPTIAYHVRNAALINGSIYAKNMRYPVIDKSKLMQSPPKHFAKAALASTFIGNRYFAHWLRDECAQFLLIEKKFGDPLILQPPPYKDAARYADYFGQDWSSFTSRAFIEDDLVVFQDFSQNSFKRRRYDALRDRVARRLTKPECADSLVYLRRGNTGARRPISNETQIIDELGKRGFITLDIETDSLEKILSTLLTAKLVISLEGSHCGHCLMALSSESGLIVLVPPDRFTASQKGWADCLSIRCGFVVGNKTASGSLFAIDDILRTMDLISHHLPATSQPAG
jgi:hypothetical protein